MMLQKLSIRNRLLFLSGALILMIAGLTYYLTTKLSDNSRAVMHNAELAALIDIAQDVRNDFGQYRYWTTDLAVSLLSQSELNANAARERLSRRLDDLARRRPDVAAVLREKIAEFEKTAMQAVELYTDDKRVLGNTVLAEARQLSVVIDDRLSALVGDLNHEVVQARDLVVADVAQTTQIVYLLVAVVTILGIAATLVVLRSILVPLRHLVSAMDGITAGDLNVPIPQAAGNEIGGMANTLRLFRESIVERARLAEKGDRLINELSESLQQQTATADVLKVISRSTFDLQTVLQTLVESAARLCEADMAAIARQKGATYQNVVSYNYPPALIEYIETHPIEIGRGTIIGRAVLEGRAIHMPDVLADAEYTRLESAKIGSFRTMLGVPLLREGVPIGVIVLIRSKVHPFTDKQIELVTTFADQAVIAIENVRLFDEVQARTRELSESLEQQTATGEILASISGSVTDTKPVFEAIVRNLRRLFGTRLAMVQVLKDGMAHLAAAAHELEFETLNQQFPRPLDGSTGSGLAMLSKQVLQFATVLGNPAAPPATQQFARELGFNAVIYAPMIRDDK